jgi:nicotinate-nucleotide adenylyltransferase
MNTLYDYSKLKRIAIMGGTFNPIHYGHLVAAEAVRQEIGVDRIVFMPSGNPPHKDSDPLYNEHRYLMSVLATSANPAFEVSRIELDRQGKTYTIDTIHQLKELCSPDCEIYFITGADAISEILTWKSPTELLSLCHFVAVTRPGYDKSRLTNIVSELTGKYKGQITFLEIPALSISSTDIRNRVLAGKTIKYLLPTSVEQYIYKYGLYNDERSQIPYINSINKQLHNLLTPKRFKHTQGVAGEAQRLAKRYGCDENKAYLAGLLHDCAKCFTPEKQLELCGKYGVPLDNILKAQPQLTHSFLGAEMAKSDFGVADNDVINAIRYHTTGRAGMSLLEKIVYIADCIEPYRDPWSGLEEIREYAYKDIDEAMICALKHSIEYNKGKIIHPLSIEALNFFTKENGK